MRIVHFSFVLICVIIPREVIRVIRFKFDILAALKAAGWSSYRLRQEKVLGQATMAQLRAGELVSWANIDRICRMLRCQPGDILEYIDSPD